MADGSQIQWTDATWNPVTGCTKVSPGCANCYIERTPAFRIPGRKFVKGAIPVVLHADRLTVPLHWRRPRRIFVNSLSDLFHEDVPFEFVDRVFAVMANCPKHTFQILSWSFSQLFESGLWVATVRHVRGEHPIETSPHSYGDWLWSTALTAFSRLTRAAERTKEKALEEWYAREEESHATAR